MSLPPASLSRADARKPSRFVDDLDAELAGFGEF
jgi:hypothetical protein